MSEALSTADRLILVVMAGLIGAWGAAGALDVSQRTEAGFSTDANHVITHLDPAGPAEVVNMRVGDEIIRIDSKHVEDTGAIVRLPRVAAGERRSYTVQRGESTIRYRPAFRTLDEQTRAREYLFTIVGFSFLLIPLAACLTQPNPATRVLTLMGMGLSLAFFDGPYLLSYDIRAVAAVVAQLFVLLGLAALVHFLLIFPHRRPLLKRSWGKKLVYVPMLIVWLLIGWRVLLTPSEESLARFVSQFFSGLVIVIYLLVGLFLLLRNYSRTDGVVRRRLALNRMLWATAAAIIPAVVAQLARIVSPSTPLPGQAYYFIALLLVPIAWSLSAIRATDSGR
jgi:hypothetical protein